MFRGWVEFVDGAIKGHFTGVETYAVHAAATVA